jgi:hypothetical protein
MIGSHRLVSILDTVSVGRWASMQKVLELVYGGFDLSKRFFHGVRELACV